MLKGGEDVLKTGLTSKQDGKMVHGMEVNWPGIMVLIQYAAEPRKILRILDAPALPAESKRAATKTGAPDTAWMTAAKYGLFM